MKSKEFLIANQIDVEKALELFGDMDLYNQTLKDFLQEIGSRIKRIQKYKEISDMANYAIEVHSLKSDSKYFGFNKLADLAFEHEQESKKNNMFFVVDHYDELMTEINRVLTIIQEYFGEEIASIPVIDSQNEIKLVESTILIVDDSNVTRNFVSKIFSKQYNVLVAPKKLLIII